MVLRRVANISLIGIAILAGGSHAAHAASSTCAFTVDLTPGVQDDSVRCLQQYLNDTGYIVAASGIGSKGHETNQFKDKTVAAVKKWQLVNGIAPATGSFGAKSRAKYKELIGNTTPVVSTPATTTPSQPIVPPTPSNSAESSVRTMLKKAQRTLDSAQGDYDSAHDDGDDTGKAKTYLDDARTALLEAYAAFINEDYGPAETAAQEAEKSGENAANEIGGGSSTSRDAAQKAIDATKKSMQSTMDDIDTADAKGKNVNKADSYISDAQENLADARTSFKTKDYQDALSYIDDANKAIAKAKSSIK